MNKEKLHQAWLEEERIAHIKGWDFSHIDSKYEEETDLPWDYREVVQGYLTPEAHILDIDTGGGEFLLSLGHPYGKTAATEGFAPNVQLCKETLSPLGIDFREAFGLGPLPFENNSFDVVINRHGDFNAEEIWRVLKPGGVFVSQQVGAENDRELIELLMTEVPALPFPEQYVEIAAKKFADAGFEIVDKQEVFRSIRFWDVGALVWFARIIEWEFPEFSVDSCLENLYRAQAILEKEGAIQGRTHRFLLVAKKPTKETAVLPQEILDLIADEEYSLDDIGKSGSSVMMFADKVLKVQAETDETKSEREMLKWLEGKLPVPRILGEYCAGDMSYLLMSKIQGKMTCDEEYMEEPQMLVSVLAEGLKRLWKVDIMDCPQVWDLDRKLAQAKKAVENGEVDVEDAEPETFGPNGFKNPQELWAWLDANRPAEELVLTHGDYCLPNIFAQAGKLSGYIDLGRMGVADKWQDIAICYRSLKHNFNGKYAAKVYEDFNPYILFDALGIEPDWEKIRYYILLDELF